MINLLYSFESNGPGKVVKNLKQGLDLLGAKYKENGDIDENDLIICLQWSNLVLQANSKNLLVGPNICTLPIDNEFIMAKKYKKNVVPSEWVKNKYSRWIPESLISVWPVGIDTEVFKDFSKETKTNDCLIYFKRRQERDLIFITKFLKSKNQKFDILQYGHYEENEMIEKAKHSKYVVLINGTESQGIAVQELMSCNLPIFVWDVEFWEDRGELYKVPATSTPYWSSICGEKTTKKEEIFHLFDVFIDKINYYNPRDFILQNLTLKSQAEEVIKLFITD